MERYEGARHDRGNSSRETIAGHRPLRAEALCGDALVDVENIARHIDNGDNFTVPTIVVSEFLFGIGSLPHAKQNQLEED